MTDDPRHRAELSDEDPLHSPGLHGRLRLLPRAFRMGLEERMRAAAGLPAWIRRTRELELRLEELESALERAWRRSDPQRWAGRAHAWDLQEINAVIVAYNLNFPIERDLPMDLRSRDYTHRGAPWRPLPPIEASWILDRFPAARAGEPEPGESR
jgi:hypothetical protein